MSTSITHENLGEIILTDHCVERFIDVLKEKNPTFLAQNENIADADEKVSHLLAYMSHMLDQGREHTRKYSRYQTAKHGEKARYFILRSAGVVFVLTDTTDSLVDALPVLITVYTKTPDDIKYQYKLMEHA
jgi:hypothetical protein